MEVLNMPAIAKVTKEMIVDAAFELQKKWEQKHNRPDSFAKNLELFNRSRVLNIIFKRLKMSEFAAHKKQRISF